MKSHTPAGPESIRAFVALPVPEDIRERIGAFQEDVKRHLTSPAIRWVSPGQIHLTLVFLGEVLAADVASMEAALRLAVAGVAPLRLSVARLGFFPNLQKPRVCWVGLEGDVGLLHALQERVVEQLKPWVPPDPKAFTPHLTLARIKFPDRVVGAAVQDLPESCADCELGQWTAGELHFMRSQLRPQGAEYTTLARLSLGGTGGHD